MPSFAAATTFAYSADQVFAILADGQGFSRWGAPLDDRGISVDHIAGPRSGEGATFRALERLDSGAIANYEFTIAHCERPRHLTMRAPRAYDRVFQLEPLGSASTRVSEIREYPGRPKCLLARMLAAGLRAEQVEDAIRRDLGRLAAMLARGPIARIPLRAAERPAGALEAI